ncbi:Hypp9522 [Branchiostoma lanceolatum]|uniref:Hypp3236 protein n=1 Tax=Branchiostoma lanceolatum TaxID=7740 RepID=A0A8K0A0M3_BRALA|nr:Hypp3236 [Branchiostoma lanceolatum]CAH1277250.1 Hypp9522 [Branchiostoma lanceolatum]
MAVSSRALLGVALVLLVIGVAVPGAQAKLTHLARSRRSGVSCQSAGDCQSGECCAERLGRCLPLLAVGQLCRPFTIQRGVDCPCTVGLHCDIPDFMKSRPVVVQSGTCAAGEAHEAGADETTEQVAAPQPGVFRPGGGRRVPSKDRVRHLIQKMAGATAMGRTLGRRMPGRLQG